MKEILARIGIVAVLFAVGLGGGWYAHGVYATAQANDDLVQQIRDERAEVKRLNKLSFDIGQALGAEVRARKRDELRHRAEINDWKAKGAVYVQCPGADAAQPIPDAGVRFDAGYIDTWNRGLCLILPQAERDSCRAAGGPVAGSGDTGPVTPSVLADKQSELTSGWGGCEDILRAVRTWAEGAGLKP